MKTYAEVRGKEPFDWNQFLNTEHDEEEWEEARGLAGNWPTCACGNLCDALPRDNGEPRDTYLADLGLEFYRNIRDRKIDQAKMTMQAIETRSTQLLRHMGIAV